MANVHQERFFLDSLKYSAEGGKKGQKEGQMDPSPLSDCHLRELCRGVGPLFRNHLVACSPEIHLGQTLQAAELKLDSQ